MTMIELKSNQLVFQFPEVHEDAMCRIEFQRTLRIPDDNREHFLPPGLGQFHLNHVDDYSEKVPKKWNQHGGIFMPMYQSEAMWINFYSNYPMVIKVAAGKIDAITGDAWTNELHEHPQNYLVLPDQPWLDGFCVEKGLIRQFVAMPLGDGYSAEEQITGEAEHGGVQLLVCPMKEEVYKQKYETKRTWLYEKNEEVSFMEEDLCMDMGLAPGGLMRQEIYTDKHGIESWDFSNYSRCFVHLLNTLQYLSITGSKPPTEPPTAKEYTNAGLPWFDYYAGDQKALKGAAKLAGLDSVAAKHVKLGKGVMEGNDPVVPIHVKKIGPKKLTVREGEF